MVYLLKDSMAVLCMGISEEIRRVLVVGFFEVVGQYIGRQVEWILIQMLLQRYSVLQRVSTENQS